MAERSRPRPEYQQRRIDFQAARARARREHAQPCDCGYCISAERAHELLLARVKANPGRDQEVPF